MHFMKCKFIQKWPDNLYVIVAIGHMLITADKNINVSYIYEFQLRHWYTSVSNASESTPQSAPLNMIQTEYIICGQDSVIDGSGLKEVRSRFVTIIPIRMIRTWIGTHVLFKCYILRVRQYHFTYSRCDFAPRHCTCLNSSTFLTINSWGENLW